MEDKVIFSLSVPKKIQSLNKYMYKKATGSFWQIKKEKELWEKLLRYTISTPAGICTQKRVLKIVSIRKKLLDYDNLVGGSKIIIDALRKMGWMVDDNDQWLAREYIQRKKEKNEEERTILELRKI